MNNLHNLSNIVCTIEQYREFITPQASQQCIAMETPLQPLGHFQQHLITGFMPIAVIDDFETVEI